jgi:hypothetical protein
MINVHFPCTVFLFRVVITALPNTLLSLSSSTVGMHISQRTKACKQQQCTHTDTRTHTHVAPTWLTVAFTAQPQTDTTCQTLECAFFGNTDICALCMDHRMVGTWVGLSVQKYVLYINSVTVV